MNAETEDKAKGAVADALADKLPAAPTLPPPSVTAAPVAEAYALPTPEQVAEMSAQVVEAVEQAAERLRKIGRTADEMAIEVKRRCDNSANEMVKNTHGTIESFKGFASMMHTLNGEVGQITDGLNKAMGTRRPAEADAFGIGANSGRGRG